MWLFVRAALVLVSICIIEAQAQLSSICQLLTLAAAVARTEEYEGDMARDLPENFQRLHHAEQAWRDKSLEIIRHNDLGLHLMVVELAMNVADTLRQFPTYPLETDIVRVSRHVSKVPEGDIQSSPDGDH